jgi:hypothetical protein
MQRKMTGEFCERLKELSAGDLRRKCARFVRDHAMEIGAAQPATPRALNDRAADLWEPLLALADLAGGGWPERARSAATALTVGAQERNPISSLLLDILVSFAQVKDGKLFSRTLLRCLSEYKDRPWVALTKGRELSEVWLAQQLRPYGVVPRTIRIGEATGKGYAQDDFKEVFRRYIALADYEEFRTDFLAQGEMGKGVASAGNAHECHE